MRSEEKWPFIFVIAIAIWMGILPVVYTSDSSTLAVRFWDWVAHDAVSLFTFFLFVSTAALWITSSCADSCPIGKGEKNLLERSTL